MPSGQFHHPARRIFSRSRSAFVSVAFITGRVIVSRRTSRMERMRRWTRSQRCCQRVSVTRGTVAERRRGVNIAQSDIERPSGCRQASARLTISHPASAREGRDGVTPPCEATASREQQPGDRADAARRDALTRLSVTFSFAIDGTGP